MLLRVVAHHSPVAQLDITRVGDVDASQHPEQRGLASTVETQYHYAAAPVDGEVNIGEHF